MPINKKTNRHILENEQIFYIGFDFSINKPAATILTPDNEYYFFAWPSSLTKTAEHAYNSIESDHINVTNRNLETISDKDESSLTYEHTARSYNLAKQIVNDIISFISNYCSKFDADAKFHVWMASEGLSFASKGNMTLNLATYKGVFLALWYEAFNDVMEYTKMYTYSPVTIKSVAGCAGKEARSQKDPMIKAFLKEPVNEFSKVLNSNTLKNKNDKYFTCVDDIVDSYWALQTMLKKQTTLR